MDEILIKKYDNRRLYCVNEGRYVSLPEIRDFVKAGRSVRVVEKTGGRDITKYILTQILLEERCEHIPLSFFQLMIRSQPGTLDLFFTQVFPRMAEAFDVWQKSGPFAGGLAGFPGAPVFPQAFPWAGGTSRADAPPPPDPEPESDPEPEPEPEPPRGNPSSAADPRVEELMKRLADLESRVRGRGAKRKK